MTEQELREQIAKEIEAEFDGDHREVCICLAITKFSAIARGNND
jgi:hypothetical protein